MISSATSPVQLDNKERVSLPFSKLDIDREGESGAASSRVQIAESTTMNLAGCSARSVSGRFDRLIQLRRA
jgi:hypothetical protein